MVAPPSVAVVQRGEALLSPLLRSLALSLDLGSSLLSLGTALPLLLLPLTLLVQHPLAFGIEELSQLATCDPLNIDKVLVLSLGVVLSGIHLVIRPASHEEGHADTVE